MNDTASPRPAAGPAAGPARLGAAAGALRTALRRPTRAATAKDALLYGALAFPVAVGLLSPPEPAGRSWWAGAAGLAALAGAVAISRAWPTAALLTGICLTAVHGNFAFAMPVLAYLAGRRTVRAQPVLWALIAVVIAGSALAVARGLEVTTWFPSTIWLVLLGVLPWLAGRYWRQYQELLHAGWERAERLEREQRIAAERERLRERARIAQDMHDSLGHELALLAVRAGALQLAPGLDERHRDAAAQLRAGAAEATDHLREIIGVLREDTAALDPDAAPDGVDGVQVDGVQLGGVQDAAAPVRPARESIRHLVERARASGVPVRLDLDLGDGDGAASPDPPPRVVLTAHRIVQEAVTNAAKHAPGAAVTVRLARRDGAVRVRVANDPPPGEPPLLPGGGNGLAGLTERVRVLGGALHAGPTPDGGFEVTAELPENPHPAPPRGPAADPPPGDAVTAATGRASGTPTAAAALLTALGLTRTPPPGEGTSESARHLARVRLQARRGLVTAIAVPAALMALLGSVMAGYHVYATLNSVLPPADYAALRVGAPQHHVQRALPPMEATGVGIVRETVPEPPHADCRYYRPDADLLGVSRIYRLCFTGGRLTAKDAYDTGRLSRQQDRRRHGDPS